MSISQAICYHQYGKPDAVLNLEEVQLPEVQPDQVKIRMLAAVINPSDLGMILGKYGKLKTLPAIAGREGVGEIVELGSAVSSFRIGQRVRMPEDCGAWQSHCVASAHNLWAIPSDIPLELAAMSFINPPTAWRILRDAHLPEGYWLIQNAANSAVGIFVIQMAKHLGLKTINLVRRPELIEPLMKMGADVVVLDNDEYPKKIRELTQGADLILGLNSVGGESAMRMTQALSEGANLITFGGMAFEPIRFPTRQLIFNQLSMTGFWMDKWYKTHSRERVQIMLERIYALMRDRTLHAPVEATFTLGQFKEAIVLSQQPRLGKVLLKA
jgi:NADPH:quinone reductase-like Zn-dependent oxidoreductase